jgi:hypothetical protein
MSSARETFNTQAISRPTADAWCVYEWDGGNSPIILNACGIKNIERVDTGVARLYFSNPERFASGAYVAITQGEVGNASSGYGLAILHGTTLNATPTANGSSASCDICSLGFFHTAPTHTNLTDTSNTFKSRVNVAFFCLRNDTDLNKTAVRNLFRFSESFKDWSLASANVSSRIGIIPKEPSPYGTFGGVHFLDGVQGQYNYIAQQVGNVNKTYTFSLHGKVPDFGAGYTLQILVGGNNNFGYNFNLLNNTLTAAGAVVSGGSLTGGIEDLGNDWKRCRITYSTPNTPTPLFQNEIANTRIYAFGAQLEEGTIASPYLYTDGAAGGTVGNQEILINYEPGSVGIGQINRQNLIPNSQGFSGGIAGRNWSMANTLGLSYGNYPAPDGTTTAVKLFEYDAGVGTAPYRKSLQINPLRGSTSGTGTMTFSVHAKAAERKRICFTDVSYGLFGVLIYDLEDGTVTQNTRGLRADMIPCGNGWWRCWATLEDTYPVPSNNNISFAFAPVDLPKIASTTIYGPTYDGVTGNGILVWGAQLEKGTILSEYTKTLNNQVVGTTFGRVYGLTADGSTRGVVTLNSSSLVAPSNLREAVAWGTIVIPPCVDVNASAGAYLENHYGVNSVLLYSSSVIDVYFTKPMDTANYCVITSTEQETVNISETTTTNYIPSTDEYTLNTIRNISSQNDQKTRNKFTITSLRQDPSSKTFTRQSVHYQRGRTQRIHFMVFGGRTRYGSE